MPSSDNDINSFQSLLSDFIRGQAEHSAQAASRLDTFDQRGVGRSPVSGNKASNVNMYISIENTVGGRGPTRVGP